MIALLLTLALVLCFGYIYWSSSYWARNSIKGPRGSPIFGNMIDFFIGHKHYGEVYQELYNAHSNLEYVGIYRLFNEPAILLRSVEMVKEVMVRSFHHFQDNVIWIDPKRDPVMWYNPFIAKSEKWKTVRAEFMPIFTPNKVKASFPHIKAISSRLADHVEKNLHKSFEAKDLFSKYTIDVVASAAYGLDAKSLEEGSSEFAELVERLFLPNPRSLIDTIALLFSPTLGNLLKFRYVPTVVQDWLKQIIVNVLKKRLDEKTGESNTNSDFIQWLIEAKLKANEPVDRLSIIGHCNTFLLEGFETSSSLMAFTLFEFARNPTVQRRVQQEIDEVLKKHDQEISYAALQDMVYFEAALLECLRLHPPMQALLKQCTKPFKMPAQAAGLSTDCTIKQGTVMVVPVRAIHYDPAVYPEPYMLKPERFTDDGDKQKLGGSFLGFGDGPRMCPGMKFGLAQTKAGLVTLLSKYNVHLAPHASGKLDLAPTPFLTVAKEGLWITFKKR